MKLTKHRLEKLAGLLQENSVKTLSEINSMTTLTEEEFIRQTDMFLKSLQENLDDLYLAINNIEDQELTQAGKDQVWIAKELWEALDEAVKNHGWLLPTKAEWDRRAPQGRLRRRK